MESVCEICDTNPIEVKCLNCIKNSLLCKKCYEYRHSADNMKCHKNEPYKKQQCQEDIKDSAKGKIEESKCDSCMCKVHPSEKKNFICKKDKVTVCSYCLIIGEHKGHDAVEFKDVETFVKEGFEKTRVECMENIENIKKMKESIENTKLKMSNNFDAIKVSINKGFKEIEKIVALKKEAIFNLVEKTCMKKMEQAEEIVNGITKLEEMTDAIKLIFSSLSKKSLNQDKFDELIQKIKDIEQQRQNKGVLPYTSEIIQKNETISDLCIEFEEIKLDTELIKKALDESIKFEQIENIKIEYNFSEMKNWIKTGVFARFKSHGGMSFDPISKQYFVGDGYQNVSQIKVYKSITDLQNKEKMHKVIELEKQMYSTYFAVYKRYIYYTDCSRKLIKASLDTGKVIASFDIINAVKDNTASFNWGGCNDISFLLDLYTNSLYAMYEEVNRTEILVSQIINSESETEIKLGKLIKIEGKKKYDFGFAFIVCDKIFLGESYSTPVISFCFNLKSRKWEEQPNISLPIDATYITHSFFTNDKKLFISDCNNGIYCLEPQ